MTRILYVPIDERPCNRVYPQDIASCIEGIELVTPPQELLGHNRVAGDIDALWKFVTDQLPSCEEAILSVDMLVYGGLVPSRIHGEEREALLRRAMRFAKLREVNPRATLTICAMVMRVPSYNDGNEEPAYYEQYGEKLFGISWYTDKIRRGSGETGDEGNLRALEEAVPREIREDFFGRRTKNFAVTSRVLELVGAGLLDAMVLPQDDTAEFGVQSGEQAAHLANVRRMGIGHKVLCYPGADEAGMELMARAVNRVRGKVPRVFVRYSSVNGASIIPLYEDRPYGESIKAHLLSAGCCVTDSAQDADFILMVNTPGAACTEASQQAGAPRTNMTHRHLGEFVCAMREYAKLGKPVAVSDVAYANGSDLELLSLMRAEDVLGKVCAYGGWNTHCNTLGSVLSCAVIAAHGGDTRPIVIERVLEDAGYMALARQELRAKVDNGTWKMADYGDPNSELHREALQKMRAYLAEEILPFTGIGAELNGVYFPWARSFEIGLQLSYNLGEGAR